MATRRRDGMWFWIGLVALVVAGYVLVTLVAAGNAEGCAGGYGSIEFVWNASPPGFKCV